MIWPAALLFLIGLGPIAPLAARIRREIALWRWRRERERRGIPVTVPRRRPGGRAYIFETRRSDAGRA